jgi:tetratricopeptide (TPR) repeat protein
MTEGKDSPPLKFDETHVDLGDDLLEKTAIIAFSKEPEVVPKPDNVQQGVLESSIDQPTSVEDALHSAKILVNEGFLEDAKKVLRKILVKDSGNALARKHLEEIHQLELKQIFGDTESRRPYRKKVEINPPTQDAEEVMRQLDEDLNLGVFSVKSLGASDPMATADQLSLFQDPRLIAEFCDRLEKDLIHADPQDWIDLGVAFLEMDLFAIAARLFSGAGKKIDLSDLNQNSLRMSVNCLLALTLILAGRPYEAISKIQPLLGDLSVPSEQKVELFYLMGRTYESMKRPTMAFQFYQKVMEIDPHYRDVDLRIRKIRD